jgi:hypothetical protein
MSNRVARIASAIFAAVFAGVPVTAILHASADAAEGCQTEPGNQTPDGKHWHYRIEHPSNRQCWYLRGEGEQPAQPRSEKSVEPIVETQTPQRSLADAHAELPWPQTRAEQNPASIPQRAQAMPTDAANAPGGQRGSVPEARGSLSGTPWPDPPRANSTPNPQPATSEVVADAQADPATAPAQAAPVTADAVPAKPTGSLQTLLMVIAGALALAGLTGSAIFRLGTRRRRAPNIDRARRRVVWEAAEGARQPQSPLQPRQPRPRQPPPRQPAPRLSSPQAYPEQTYPEQTYQQTYPWVDPEYARRPGFAPALAETSDHNERLDKISEFLERMSKQPTN